VPRRPGARGLTDRRSEPVQELTFINAGQVEWREVAAPTLEGPREAIVRPLAVATCDLDAAIVKGWIPLAGPFPLGHEFVGEVVEVGEDVTGVEPGQRCVVPFQISCGSCAHCHDGLTANCLEVPSRSMYGLGPLGGAWGGAFSDAVRVPFPEAMLVPLPDGVSPEIAASVSDNIPDAWRAVAPPLAERPGAEVLVVGGGATSISLYAIAIALTLGSTRVDYVDHDTDRLELAGRIGAHTIEATEPPQDGVYPGHFPERLGPYPITVDASAHPAGLALALRSTGVAGTCTVVGVFYTMPEVPIPLREMYPVGVTLKHGRVHARATIPAVLGMIGEGKFDPSAITTATAGWDDAASALAEAPTKLIVSREPAGLSTGRAARDGSQSA
jgi:threonine dehydrogenase-like Zn-dependent dehydrogenase